MMQHLVQLLMHGNTDIWKQNKALEIHERVFFIVFCGSEMSLFTDTVCCKWEPKGKQTQSESSKTRMLCVTYVPCVKYIYDHAL